MSFKQIFFVKDELFGSYKLDEIILHSSPLPFFMLSALKGEKQWISFPVLSFIQLCYLTAGSCALIRLLIQKQG